MTHAKTIVVIAAPLLIRKLLDLVDHLAQSLGLGLSALQLLIRLLSSQLQRVRDLVLVLDLLRVNTEVVETRNGGAPASAVPPSRC